jgi:hypothetical protein
LKKGATQADEELEVGEAVAEQEDHPKGRLERQDSLSNADQTAQVH